MNYHKSFWKSAEFFQSSLSPPKTAVGMLFCSSWTSAKSKNTTVSVHFHRQRLQSQTCQMLTINSSTEPGTHLQVLGLHHLHPHHQYWSHQDLPVLKVQPTHYEMYHSWSKWETTIKTAFFFLLKTRRKINVSSLCKRDQPTDLTKRIFSLGLGLSCSASAASCWAFCSSIFISSMPIWPGARSDTDYRKQKILTF